MEASPAGPRAPETGPPAWPRPLGGDPGTEIPVDEALLAPGLLGPSAEQDPGALLWDFLVSFVGARHAFQAIFDRYEERVLSASRRLGVSREALELPPKQLFELFHLRRLRFLKEVRLRTLRDLAERIFAEGEHEELLDVYCNHIYGELSILAEEHRSVGRFVRIYDRRRYRQLFEEVSGYYPARLRRIRWLFTGGLRRIEILLPQWAQHRAIIRGVYLFGDRLAHLAYGRDVGAIYGRMYPRGGEIAGFLAAARSFLGSGFMIRAREAAARGAEAVEGLRERRRLERDEQVVADEVVQLLARLDEEAGVRPEGRGLAPGADGSSRALP